MEKDRHQAIKIKQNSVRFHLKVLTVISWFKENSVMMREPSVAWIRLQIASEKRRGKERKKVTYEMHCHHRRNQCQTRWPFRVVPLLISRGKAFSSLHHTGLAWLTMLTLVISRGLNLQWTNCRDSEANSVPIWQNNTSPQKTYQLTFWSVVLILPLMGNLTTKGINPTVYPALPQKSNENGTTHKKWIER